MYIMACLCILKIYQNRHPDISANSHSSYMVMALIIIVAVLGVVGSDNTACIIGFKHVFSGDMFLFPTPTLVKDSYSLAVYYSHISDPSFDLQHSGFYSLF